MGVSRSSPVGPYHRLQKATKIPVTDCGIAVVDKRKCRTKNGAHTQEVRPMHQHGNVAAIDSSSLTRCSINPLSRSLPPPLPRSRQLDNRSSPVDCDRPTVRLRPNVGLSVGPAGTPSISISLSIGRQPTEDIRRRHIGSLAVSPFAITAFDKTVGCSFVVMLYTRWRRASPHYGYNERTL